MEETLHLLHQRLTFLETGGFTRKPKPATVARHAQEARARQEEEAAALRRDKRYAMYWSVAAIFHEDARIDVERNRSLKQPIPLETINQLNRERQAWSNTVFAGGEDATYFPGHRNLLIRIQDFLWSRNPRNHDINNLFSREGRSVSNIYYLSGTECIIVKFASNTLQDPRIEQIDYYNLPAYARMFYRHESEPPLVPPSEENGVHIHLDAETCRSTDKIDGVERMYLRGIFSVNAVTTWRY